MDFKRQLSESVHFKDFYYLALSNVFKKPFHINEHKYA